MRRVVQSVNGLKPDMVAVTGDLVDGSTEHLAKHVEPLRDLSSADGTFFVKSAITSIIPAQNRGAARCPSWD